MIEPETAILFRDVTAALPDFLTKRLGGVVKYYDANAQWFYAELHVSNHGTYGPTGLATVCVNAHGVEILNLFVLEHMRRAGYGRQLMEAIRERWLIMRRPAQASIAPLK